ncbi:MAG: hypothetical protein KGI49_02440, partial [Patescibacteria group bacterium]|nr:hypothetical protein [Patescibacteria group bacterium]
MTNNTFSGNTASTSGVTIEQDGSIATITNSIFSGGSPDNCHTNGGTIVSGGHNIDSGNSCGFNATGDATSTDPLLDPNGLQDNGGPTKTIALLSNSPAIDAGDDTVAPSTDQRGIARPQDGNGDGTAVSDIGAY